MGLSIFPIHNHLVRAVGRMIDLETVNGNLPAELIKQMGIKAGIATASSRVGDKIDRATTVSRITDLSQVVGGPEESGICDHLASRWFSCSVAQCF